jgi:AP-3 complex subunit delta-1
LASPDLAEVSLALYGLSHFVTHDLARDISADVVSLFRHDHPIVRKKAVLTLLPFIRVYPDIMQLVKPKLQSMLGDASETVVMAAVTVYSELIQEDAQAHVSISPLLFQILTNARTRNWVNIKILRMLVPLCQVEPRLIKKVLPPVTLLLQESPALSLVSECVSLLLELDITKDTPALSALCIEKLKMMIEHRDQNLRHTGLTGLSKFTKTTEIYRLADTIMACTNDANISVRFQAIDLVAMLINSSNLMGVTDQLVHSLQSDPVAGRQVEFRNHVINVVLKMVTSNLFEHVTDFEWCVDTLMQLAHLAGDSETGYKIGTQLIELGLRVPTVRSYLFLRGSAAIRTVPRPKYTLAQVIWVTGEYCDSEHELESLIDVLLSFDMLGCDSDVQMSSLQAVMKLVVFRLNSSNLSTKTHVVYLIKSSLEPLSAWLRSDDVNVLSRAQNLLGLLTYMQSLLENDEMTHFRAALDLASSLFGEEMVPVSERAQNQVTMPVGLDLSSHISTRMEKLSTETLTKPPTFFSAYFNGDTLTEPPITIETEEERRQRLISRVELLRSNPFYVDSSGVATPPPSQTPDPVGMSDCPVEVIRKKPKKVHQVKREAILPDGSHEEVPISRAKEKKKRKKKQTDKAYE